MGDAHGSLQMFLWKGVETLKAWETGIAEVVNSRGPNIQVLCPHCAKRHYHSRASLGSKSVVAGCHVGVEGRYPGDVRLREYRIPKRG